MLYSRLFVRTVALIAWDFAAWIMAAVFVLGIRYSWLLSEENWNTIFVFMTIAMGVYYLIGCSTKLLVGKYRIGSFEESYWLFGTVMVSVFTAYLAQYALPQFSPAPFVFQVVMPFITVIGVLVGRGAFRGLKVFFRKHEVETKRTLLVGAGTLAYQLIRLIEDDVRAPYEIIGMVDDSPNKRNLRLGRVRVLGKLEDISAIIRAQKVEQVIVAIAEADSALLTRISDLVGNSLGTEILVIPPVSAMGGKYGDLSTVRKISITDVLGRRQVKTDLTQIASYINGKRVLVTGAGGSIGSEICRQVKNLGPERLIMLDRDESALHGISLDLYNTGLLNTPDFVLCDIRDAGDLRKIFETHQPEVIFHTAALKHLPMLQQYPEEGWKTNVLGTLNLLRLATEFKVEAFVNISTDKAANPTTVLGKTKRLAERLTAYFAQEFPGKFLSVRFGNVLGSRGSMLWTFQKQIEDGGPITVTHPDVERYFMTIPEACALVIQAGAIGCDGEVLVLDMGEPVKILEVAKKMIAMQNRPIDIVFTGLRPGEKLSEILVTEGEEADRPFHPLISHSTVEPLDPQDLSQLHEQTCESEIDAYLNR